MYLSGVPWWVWMWTLPGRLGTAQGQLTLLTRNAARSTARRYCALPRSTCSVSGGSAAASSSPRTTHTPRRCGAISRALRWIAPGSPSTPRCEKAE